MNPSIKNAFADALAEVWTAYPNATVVSVQWSNGQISISIVEPSGSGSLSMTLSTQLEKPPSA
jgi:hypothetical protein